MSAIFGKKELAVINRFGDIMLPKNGDFPSFSETGVIAHIDNVLRYAHADDLKDLSLLFSILYFMPNSLLRFLVRKMEVTTYEQSGFLASLYRSMNIGVKGIIFTLYYSEWVGLTYQGKTPLQIMDYQLTRLEK